MNPLGVAPTFAQGLEGDELRQFERARAEIDRLRRGLAGNQQVAQTEP